MLVIGTKEHEGLYKIRLCHDTMSDCQKGFEFLMNDILL
jgi:hypothetical protein